MKREPLYQRVGKIGKNTFNIEIAFSREKVYITCIEVVKRKIHIVEVWRKQAGRIIEMLTSEPANEYKCLHNISVNGLKALISVLRMKHGRVCLNLQDSDNRPIL